MLKTNIAGVDLQSCVYNASGVNCTTKDELLELSHSSSGAVVSKSCTLEYREGNPKPRYFENDTCSINSTGLANFGYKYYGDIELEKPYFVSVCGLSEENNMTMLKYLDNKLNICCIELNLSCPNIIGKSQVGYDFETMGNFLRKVNEIGLQHKLGLKLPPYFDMVHFNQASEIINENKIDFLTCINSLGNGIVIDTDTDRVGIKPKRGFGGIGGSVVKSIALSNVRKFYELTDCDIVGCGGVVNGRDVYDHILCGASAVQIGTQLKKEGVSVFDRINDELGEVMKSRGYSELSQFRGQLNEYE
tara:strand:- start:1217 stop:2128 length:912 start_codon:yes stop_codon:yes gene_type:complete